MADDPRDPELQRLFASADEDLAGEVFVADVLARTDRDRRRVVMTRIVIGLGLALTALPFQDVMFVLAQIPLVALSDGWAAQLLGPFNSVGSVISLVAIGLRVVYRKIFSR